jgi:hypothetical protein
MGIVFAACAFFVLARSAMSLLDQDDGLTGAVVIGSDQLPTESQGAASLNTGSMASGRCDGGLSVTLSLMPTYPDTLTNRFNDRSVSAAANLSVYASFTMPWTSIVTRWPTALPRTS